MKKEQKKLLLSIARSSIRNYLENRQIHYYSESELKDPDLFEKRATFVTLTIGDELRGCIGSLTPTRPLFHDVIENSINAAFRDPRFYPLSLEEFDKINIEISVLTIPKRLEFEDTEDLLKKIRPGIDGVIIKKGFYEATFLPQVWSDLPDKKSFFEQLCLKAGLGRNCYSTNKIKVETYQVEALSEKEFE
jgi:AmmeMemoRadiSam system protein A